MQIEQRARLLALALDGDGEALGDLLEEHRAYLIILASRELDPLVSARLSGSDLAQQTCLEAIKAFAQFRGTTPQEFGAWLNQILANTLIEATRVHLVAQKRSVLNEHRDGSNVGNEFGRSLESSPSSRLMRGEQAIQLASMMQQLPPDQFEAIRLRYLEGFSVSELADRMDRSEQAVAGLLKRGLQNLRSLFAREEGSQDE